MCCGTFASNYIMQQDAHIAITGAAGFIASYVALFLNELGFRQLYLIDDFSRTDKKNNYEGLHYIQCIHRDEVLQWFSTNPRVDFMIHLGARTDTTEMDYTIHEALNVNYSKMIWEQCVLHQIPLIYASSAATYGDGELGYTDNHDIIPQLQPLNPYGISKNEFDKWVLTQQKSPPHWHGLKFFNVYGPNEYHKGRMASVIFHAYHQIKQNGYLKLFKSHKPAYRDGEQLRDFIYVKDVASIIYWLMKNQPQNGIYNVGTGKAATFLDLGRAVFEALQLNADIRFIDTPEDIRESYQYFTEADMQKLINAGYTHPMYTIRDGAIDYVRNYLLKLE